MINLKGLTILIVEDEADLREVLVDEFRERGCETVEAENGQMALALVKSRKFALVITDSRMPGGSGPELIKEIGQLQGYRPPIILTTGYSEAHILEVAVTGAAAVLLKPFQRDLLFQTVLRVLEK